MRKSNKFCSDYYRMTGNIYKPGPKTFLRRYFFHNLQFAFYFRKYKEKENVFSRLVLYRLSRKYGLEISPKAEIGYYSQQEMKGHGKNTMLESVF